MNTRNTHIAPQRNDDANTSVTPTACQGFDLKKCRTRDTNEKTAERKIAGSAGYVGGRGLRHGHARATAPVADSSEFPVPY